MEAAASPVPVRTPAGPLRLRRHRNDIFLTGLAEIVAGGMAAAASPVPVRTPAGPLSLRWDGNDIFTRPAGILAGGESHLER